MEVINNPTSRSFKQNMWGFEITHIIGAISMASVTNVLISMIGGPVYLSWILGAATLVFLRLLSFGKKPGHLQFLINWLFRPRSFLGSSLLRVSKGEQA